MRSLGLLGLTLCGARGGSGGEPPPSLASLNIAWDDNSLVELGYRVRWEPTAGGTTLSADLAVNTESFWIGALQWNTQYDIEVVAFNGDGESGAAGPVSLYTKPPAAPTDCEVVETTTTSATVSWTLPATEPVTGYKVYRSPAGVGTWAAAGTVAAGVNELLIAGLTAGNSYDFRVVGYNSNASEGQPDAETAPSNTDSLTLSSFTYLLVENFGGPNSDDQSNPGYDNTGVRASSGTVDAQYATSPAPLEGTHSLRPGTSSAWAEFPIAGNPRSFFCRAKPVTTTATTTMRLLSGGATVAIIEISGGQKLRPTHGTVVGSYTTDSFYVGPTWRLWFDYMPASGGADGVLKIAFSTDNTKPTSGAKFVQLTTGDATLEVDAWRVGGLGSNVIFDTLRAAATEIGSDPA